MLMLPSGRSWHAADILPALLAKSEMSSADFAPVPFAMVSNFGRPQVGSAIPDRLSPCKLHLPFFRREVKTLQPLDNPFGVQRPQWRVAAHRRMDQLFALSSVCSAAALAASFSCSAAAIDAVCAMVSFMDWIA
jgi:hypothetical protein